MYIPSKGQAVKPDVVSDITPTDEMRMLLDFSKKKLIPLYEEINLCKAHLQVMSLRQEKSYSLDIKGEYENIFLPPLIIHTLVENGLWKERRPYYHFKMGFI